MTILQNAIDMIKNNDAEYVKDATFSCIERESILIYKVEDGSICNSTREMAKSIPSNFASWSWIKKDGRFVCEREGYRYEYSICVPKSIRYAGMTNIPVSLFAWDVISAYSECGSPTLVYEDWICREDTEVLRGFLEQMLKALKIS